MCALEMAKEEYSRLNAEARVKTALRKNPSQIALYCFQSSQLVFVYEKKSAGGQAHVFYAELTKYSLCGSR